MLSTLRIIFSAILVVLELIIIVSVLLQKSKSEGLSSIMGGNDTDNYYSRNKGGSKDAKLSKITKISTIILVVISLILTILFAVPAVTATVA